MVSGKLVRRGGMIRPTEITESCTVAAGGTDNRIRGKATKNPADMLGKGGDKMRGVDLGVKASNAMCARFIRGSDISDISF